MYANIQNASPLAKGMEAPAIVNAPRTIDVASTPFAEIDKLPEFIQKKMKSSEEYVARVARVAAGADHGPIEQPAASAAPGKLQKPAVLGGPGNLNSNPNPDDIPF